LGGVAPPATRCERIRRTVQQRPMLQNKVVPRALVAIGASACQREVFQVQAGEVLFDIPRYTLRAQGALRTRLERLGKALFCDVPTPGVGTNVQAIDQPGVNLHARAVSSIHRTPDRDAVEGLRARRRTETACGRRSGGNPGAYTTRSAPAAAR